MHLSEAIQVTKRKRLKAGKIGSARGPQVHDRTAAEMPMNASVRTLTVDDPYEAGGKIVVAASIRDDPLGRLHARGQIDEAQYHAGRHWQAAYEASQISPLRAMDTTKEPVDGSGGFAAPISDANHKAMLELARADRALGLEGSALIRDILGERIFIEAAAARRGISDERGHRYLSRRLRECLETLALVYGYAGRA